MTTHPAYKRIGVFGHYGIGNLGDEAIVAAVIASLRRRLPQTEIVCFSMNPADSAERYGVKAFPVRRSAEKVAPPTETKAPASVEEPPSSGGLRALVKKIPVIYPLLRALIRLPDHVINLAAEIAFLNRSKARLRGTDLLLIAGSGPVFDNFGGPWAFPYTLFKWVRLCRSVGTKAVFLSVGAGPIKHPWSRRLLRRALNGAAFHSFRDEYSRDLALSLGLKKPAPVAPDLACGLDLGDRLARDLPKAGLVVGLNPLPYADRRYWPENDDTVYRDYVNKLAVFTLWLIQRGCRVVVFNTKVRADSLVVDDILSRIKEHAGNVPDAIETPKPHRLGDLLDVIAGCDLIVAGRFHGVLLSCLLRRPTVGLAYHPKTVAMMNYLGVGDYSLDIATFRPEELQTAFQRLETEAAGTRTALEPGITAAQAALEAQYDEILQL